jgi:hypothetical protein
MVELENAPVGEAQNFLYLTPAALSLRDAECPDSRKDSPACFADLRLHQC